MTNENLIDALKEKISSLEEWYARERTACMKQFKQVEALTADRNDWKARAEAAERIAENRLQTFLSVSETLENAVAAHKAAESELATLRAELEEASKAYEGARLAYEAQLRELRAENERLRDDRDNWQCEAVIAESRCAELEKEVERQKKLVELAELSATAHRCNAAELEKEVGRLRALLVSDPIESARQYFEQAKVAESRCAELEKEMETLRSIDNKASENG